MSCDAVRERQKGRSISHCSKNLSLSLSSTCSWLHKTGLKERVRADGRGIFSVSSFSYWYDMILYIRYICVIYLIPMYLRGNNKTVPSGLCWAPLAILYTYTFLILRLDVKHVYIILNSVEHQRALRAARAVSWRRLLLRYEKRDSGKGGRLK